MSRDFEQSDFFQSPEILASLGDEAFLKIPLFRAKQPYDILYVNHSLYLTLFNNTASYEEARCHVAELFSIALYGDASFLAGDEVIGDAYVDYQADPSDIALSGNLGSGRAFYFGKCFNAKGMKTPLAVSDHSTYNSGVLDFEKALIETLVANSLSRDGVIAAAPILAILDTGQRCRKAFSPTGELAKRVMIIRLVKHCPLHRFTHDLLLKKPLQCNKLYEAASNIGRLEAKKFMERIFHGAWSAGNISRDGDLIDLETVVAVKGRHPQYRITDLYLGNYFGFEQEGQLLALQLLLDQPAINIDKVSNDELRQHLDAAYQKQLVHSLLVLMGCEATEDLSVRFGSALHMLAVEFHRMAQLSCGILDALSTGSPLSMHSMVFDLSTFCRFFPLLKRYSADLRGESCQLLLSSMTRDSAGDDRIESMMPSSRRSQIYDDVYTQIEDLFVIDVTLAKLQAQAEHFVDRYEKLFDEMISSTNDQMLQVEKRAYVVNEDRRILFGCATVVRTLSGLDQSHSFEYIGQLIEMLIRANQRHTDDAVTDLQLYSQGYSLMQLDGRGHYVVHCVLTASTWEQVAVTRLQICLNGERVKTVGAMTAAGMHLVSGKRSNQDLLHGRPTIALFDTEANSVINLERL